MVPLMHHQASCNPDHVLAPLGALSAPLCQLYDITIATPVPEEHRPLFWSTLKALEIQESLFRPSLSGFDSTWRPIPEEEHIIQDAWRGLYEDDDPENTFFRYGGFRGIVALVLAYRKTESILSQLATIEVKSVQELLVNNVVKLFTPEQDAWFDNYIMQVSPKQHPVRCLGNDTGQQRELRRAQGQAIPTPKSRSSSFDLHHRQYDEHHRRKRQRLSVEGDAYLDTISGQWHQSQIWHHRKQACVSQHTFAEDLPFGPDLTRQSSSFEQHRAGSPLPEQHNLRQDPLPERKNFSQPQDWMAVCVIDTPQSDQEGLEFHHTSAQTSSGFPAKRTSTASKPNLQPTLTPVTSPSSSSEVITHFYNLSDDAKLLVNLLVYLGASEVPLAMLLRVTEPHEDFDRNGLIHGEDAVGLAAVFSHEGQVTSAITSLETYQLITSTAGPMELPKYGVVKQLRDYVEEHTSRYLVPGYKVHASRLICHTFPSSEDAQPFHYIEIGRMQLPHARRILTYLRTPALLKKFTVQERRRLVRFCLSLSRFSTPSEKYKSLSTATKIRELGLDDMLLAAKVSLRKRELYRLFPESGSASGHTEDDSSLPPDVASNAYRADKLLLDVQHLIDQDQLSSAWSMLDVWRPENPDSPSDLEKCAMAKITLLRAKICRFSGHFNTARDLLLSLCETSVGSVSATVLSQLVAVYCELGIISAARNLLSLEKQDLRYFTWLRQARGRRIKVALAQVELTAGLQFIDSKTFEAAQPCLHRAGKFFQEFRAIFDSLQSPGLDDSINNLYVAFGLAIIAHSQCLVSESLELQIYAYRCWESAWEIAEHCQTRFGWKPNFNQTIIYYSMSDIKRRQGSAAESIRYFDAAMTQYLHTGIHTYWVGLATWFDVLGDLREQERLPRIGRRRRNLSMDGRHDFPFTVNSRRPVY